MFLRVNTMFVLLFVLPASLAAFTRFTLPRVDYKLQTATWEARRSSLTTCCVLCNDMDECRTASYKASERRCLLGRDLVTHDGNARTFLETEQGWVTMSKVVYTVYNRSSPVGTYKSTFEDAESLCAEHGNAMASPEDLLASRSRGLELCTCGWLSNGSNGFVIQQANPLCWGDFSTGIVYCGFSEANVWCKL